jgi:hypothetical protein
MANKPATAAQTENTAPVVDALDASSAVADKPATAPSVDALAGMNFRGDRLPIAEHVRSLFHCTIPLNHPYEAALRASYFGPAWRQLKPGFIIECVAEDLSWYATIMVVEIGNNFVRTAPITGKIDLAANDTGEYSLNRLRVQFLGQNKLYCVVRESDNVVVKEGFADKASAARWAATNEDRV